MINVLRDCSHAIRVWKKLVPMHLFLDFNTVNLEDGIFFNLQQRIDIGSGLYRADLCISCWFLWNWRNKEVHDASFLRPYNPMKTIINYAEEVTRAYVKRTSSSREIGTIEVFWNPLGEGWFKLNTDAAVNKEI